MNAENVREELLECSGGQFDPYLVEMLLKSLNEDGFFSDTKTYEIVQK